MPDQPGCFSAGNTMDEAVENARHAIDQHVGILIEDGVSIPLGRPLAVHQADPDYADWVWAIVDVPVEKYLGPAENINSTVPRLIPAHIDEYAKSRDMSRSGLLVEAARSAMHAWHWSLASTSLGMRSGIALHATRDLMRLAPEPLYRPLLRYFVGQNSAQVAHKALMRLSRYWHTPLHAVKGPRHQG